MPRAHFAILFLVLVAPGCLLDVQYGEADDCVGDPCSDAPSEPDTASADAAAPASEPEQADAGSPDAAPLVNLFANGDFAAADEAWNFSLFAGAIATLDAEAGEAAIQIDDAGTEPWHVSLGQNPLTIEAGTTYEFRFTARTPPGTTRTLSTQFYSPTLGGLAFEAFIITEDPQDFVMVHEATQTATDVSAKFNLAHDAQPVVIDDVVLTY